jgi:hypothetical protein
MKGDATPILPLSSLRLIEGAVRVDELAVTPLHAGIGACHNQQELVLNGITKAQ